MSIFTGLIGKGLDFAASETFAKIVLKIGVAAYATYSGKTLSPDTIATIGATYLALSAAIDAWYHKSYLPADVVSTTVTKTTTQTPKGT